MPTLHLLGTGAALSAPDRTTTMLAIEASSVVVVDCGGDVVQRMLASGLDLSRLGSLILTHEHPDHVSGFPLFMEKIWLARRRAPIPVCGPAAALDQARRIFEAFDTSRWEGLPAIDWREVALEEGAPVWADESVRVTASPGSHGVPVIGIRVDVIQAGAIAYSSDTERSDGIARLARGAAILVHEATGAFRGHATASDAALVARDAAAKRLVLVHLPPTPNPEDLARARAVFPSTELAHDGARYDF